MSEMPIMIRKAEGFALIDLLFVCGILSVLCTIALPRMLMARQSAGAASAIGSLRAINSAQLTYALTCGGGFYAPNLTTLGNEPPSSREAFISPNLSGSDTLVRSGYRIELEATAFAGAPSSCNGLEAGATAQGFKAGAEPMESGNPRYFATNANAQIVEHHSPIFPAMPETGEPAVGRPLR
jgi:type IV pilus assembly protein PilA